MQEDYKVLGVEPTDSNEVIKEKYESLRAKYSVERFLEGEAGNNAAKQLTLIEQAYKSIMDERKTNGSQYKYAQNNTDTNAEGKKEEQSVYTEIENLIKAGNISSAQTKLDAFDERDAEWHYVQAMLYYKKNWLNESKKQLEIAKNMEPDNNKYANAYNKMISNQGRRVENTQQQSSVPPTQPQQMGNDGCKDVCTCCQAAICAVCLCNCCQ